MSPADLVGRVLGTYEVRDPIGAGRSGIVYRALEKPGERLVALKVLDPELASRPGFVERLTEDSAAISRLAHPGIVPVYEVGTAGSLTYVAMRLVEGAPLGALVARHALDLPAAGRLLDVVAGAVHSAHEAGVLHRALRSSNVLVEMDGTAVVTDFAMTPALASQPVLPLWPATRWGEDEDEIDLAVDRRVDVRALGALLFEMVTGTRPYPPAGVRGGRRGCVPSARERNPHLPAELDQVLFRALAVDPSQRPATVPELMDALGEVPQLRRPSRRPVDQVPAVIEASPDPVVVVDTDGLVTHWNGRAEALFGWTRSEIVGRPVTGTLIAPRHREPFERLVALCADSALADGAGPRRSSEVVALRRDGRQVPLDVSLSTLRAPDGGTRVVAFLRDVSERRDAERLAALREAADAAIEEAQTADELAARALEAVAAALDVAAGAVWLGGGQGSPAGCAAWWSRPALAGSELEALTRAATFPASGWPAGDGARAATLPGSGPRERAAAAAGVRSAIAVPIDDGGVRIGVLELLTTEPPAPAAGRMATLDALARRLGQALRRLPMAPARGRVRYRVDPRNTDLGFSCRFMRFMTVHGSFRDFGGWVEVDRNDPASAVAHCTIRTASVDTGSLERDYHIGSPDFFAVEQFPEMTFRSTGVRELGDEQFRLFGELTIREVTRPLRLDVRLEDWEIDAAGGERATLSAHTVIHRADWFLDWERALQAGRWIVGDEVRLDLLVTLVRRPESPGRVP